MTDNTKFRTGPGGAGSTQQLTVPVAPTRQSTQGTRHFTQIGAVDEQRPVEFPEHLSIDKFTIVEVRATLALIRALNATGAEWITETQWRAWATAEHTDYQVRGFRIPELINKGVLEETSALFHAPKYGAPAAPLPLYRITRPEPTAK